MELKVDHNSPVPLHAQVEKLLRDMIKQPPYRDGELLPREVDLARRLGISRNTLRQATNKLEYEGLLVRRKGLGTKVAGKDVVTHLQQWHSFTQEMNEKGVHFLNYELFTEWVKAQGKVGHFFKVSEDTLVLKLSRLRGDEDGPFVFFESYFHPSIGLSENEDFTRPLYDILEQDYHVVPSLSEERIKARHASAIASGKLNIPKAEPVLVRERFVYDAGNRPIEYNRGVYRADKFTYSISIQR